jgi:hypothetical protein
MENGGEFADYLGRMQDSSKDYVEFAERWLKSPRPRVIGWFGDHEPEPAWQFMADKYVTRYQLSSNRSALVGDAPEHTLDVSFLGDRILAFAGLPLDDAAQAALAVSKNCNGRLFDCADRELVQDYLSFRIHNLRAIE